MANDLPLTISMGPLSPNIAYTPQELADAIAERLSIQSQQTFALFVSGSTEPTSNVGPWLKDGVTWYVWDNNSGDYIPQVLPSASLRYIIGETPPDPDDYNFWIQTAADLRPLALKTYYSGLWTDVYADSLGSYMTVADFNAAIASYSTTAQMNAAISTALSSYSTTAQMNAAIAAAAPQTYPAQGVVNNQAVPIDGLATPTKLVFNSAPINPAPAPFDTTLNRYIAPAAGNYMVAFSCQCDKTGGAVAATMQVNAALYKNGSFVGNLLSDLDNTPSPNGDRWSPGFSGMVACATNDYLEIFVGAEDGTNVDSLTTSAQFSVWRVSA